MWSAFLGERVFTPQAEPSIRPAFAISDTRSHAKPARHPPNLSRLLAAPWRARGITDDAPLLQRLARRVFHMRVGLRRATVGGHWHAVLACIHQGLLARMANAGVRKHRLAQVRPGQKRISTRPLGRRMMRCPVHIAPYT